MVARTMTVYNAYHGLIATVAVCTTASKHYSVSQWEFFTLLCVIIFLFYASTSLYTCESAGWQNIQS